LSLLDLQQKKQILIVQLLGLAVMVKEKLLDDLLGSI
jgi:hypothetical protein